MTLFPLTLNSDPASPIPASKGFAYNSSKAALNMFTVLLGDALKDTQVKAFSKTDLGGENAMLEVADERYRFSGISSSFSSWENAS